MVPNELLTIAIGLIAALGGFVGKRIFSLIDGLRTDINDTYKKREIDRMIDKIDNNNKTLHEKIDKIAEAVARIEGSKK